LEANNEGRWRLALAKIFASTPTSKHRPNERRDVGVLDQVARISRSLMRAT